MRLLNCRDGKISPKRTAIEYLRWQEATLRRILEDAEALGDDSALPRLAHAWLEQSDAYDERRWLDYDQKAKAWETLEEFLATHADIPMTQESFAQFSQQLAPLVNAIRIFPHDGRRMLGMKALNSRLEQLGLCFKLQKMGRNSKTILKKEEELGYV